MLILILFLGESLTMRLRSQTFESMLKQDIGWYDRKENNTGKLAFDYSNHLHPPPPPSIPNYIGWYDKKVNLP